MSYCVYTEVGFLEPLHFIFCTTTFSQDSAFDFSKLATFDSSGWNDVYATVTSVIVWSAMPAHSHLNFIETQITVASNDTVCVTISSQRSLGVFDIIIIKIQEVRPPGIQYKTQRRLIKERRMIKMYFTMTADSQGKAIFWSYASFQGQVNVNWLINTAKSTFIVFSH